MQIPAERALARRMAASENLDRIESRGSTYLRKVAEGYEALVAEGALTAVSAEQSIEAVASDIWGQVKSVGYDFCVLPYAAIMH